MPGSVPSAVDANQAKIVEAALKAAKGAVGKPYTEGGKTTAGFDCSGFVYYVLHQVFPDYDYLDTSAIRISKLFTTVTSSQPGDLIFFPKGKNPYEVRQKNNKEFPNHVGIVLNGQSWIGSQSTTGVAQVALTNPWWSARHKIYLRHN
jgi:cell wall-associated NlpC family hydrolase